MRPVASAGDRFKTCALSERITRCGQCLPQLLLHQKSSNAFRACDHFLRLGSSDRMRALAMTKPSMGLIRYWHR